MLILAFIGLLCMQTILQIYILVALESNTFQKKKAVYQRIYAQSQQIFLE